MESGSSGQWEGERASFQAVKRALTSTPLLCHVKQLPSYTKDSDDFIRGVETIQ